jgi:hypothetical protein
LSKSPINSKNKFNGKLNSEKKNINSNKYQRPDIPYQLDEFLSKDYKNKRKSIGKIKIYYNTFNILYYLFFQLI